MNECVVVGICNDNGKLGDAVVDEAGDFEPYRRHYDELDENEQAAVFMLEMDPRCFVASVGV